MEVLGEALDAPPRLEEMSYDLPRCPDPATISQGMARSCLADANWQTGTGPGGPPRRPGLGGLLLDASRTTPPEVAIVSTRPRAGAGGGHAGRGASTLRPGDVGGRAPDSDKGGSGDSLLHGVVVRLLEPDELHSHRRPPCPGGAAWQSSRNRRLISSWVAVGDRPRTSYQGGPDVRPNRSSKIRRPCSSARRRSSSWRRRSSSWRRRSRPSVQRRYRASCSRSACSNRAQSASARRVRSCRSRQVDGGTPPPAVGAAAGRRLGGLAGLLVPAPLVVGPPSGLVRRLVRPARRLLLRPPPRRVDPFPDGRAVPAPATGDTSRSPAARRGSGAARRRGASPGSPARPARCRRSRSRRSTSRT